MEYGEWRIMIFMRKIYLFALLLFLITCKEETNKMKSEKELLQQADSLFHSGKLEDATKEYKEILKQGAKNKRILYRLASSYSLLQKEETAFYYLKSATELDSSLYYISDPYYYNLLGTQTWDNLLDDLISRNTDVDLSDTKSSLIKELINLGIKDQAFYYEIDNFPNKGFYETKKDSLTRENIKELEDIIQKNGWPKLSEVGEICSRSAFLVLQHSDLDMQLKYANLLAELDSKDEIDKSNYALFLDRIRFRQSQKQLFGSQINYDAEKDKYFIDLNTIENPNKINQRRKEYGLEPIEDYLKRYNIEWDVSKQRNYSTK